MIAGRLTSILTKLTQPIAPAPTALEQQEAFHAIEVERASSFSLAESELLDQEGSYDIR